MGHISHYMEYCVKCNCCIQWRIQKFLRMFAELKLWALAVPALLSCPLTCHLLHSATLSWHPTSPSVLLPSLPYFSSGCPSLSPPGQIVGMKDHRSLLFGYSISYKLSTAVWSIFWTVFPNFPKIFAKAYVFEETRTHVRYKTGSFLVQVFGGLVVIIWQATNG